LTFVQLRIAHPHQQGGGGDQRGDFRFGHALSIAKFEWLRARVNDLAPAKT
jgi:hypothetical protein